MAIPLEQLSGTMLEELTSALLQADGFSFERTQEEEAADLGYDFIAIDPRTQERWAVQCKAGASWLSVHAALRALSAVPKLVGAARALLVTDTAVSDNLRKKIAEPLQIELWDRSDLQRLLRQPKHRAVAKWLSARLDPANRRAGWLRLVTLSIRNYRGIAELEIDFQNENDITLLVGRNGAGKTAILEALAVLLSWLARRMRSADARGMSLSSLDVRNGTPRAEITLRADVEGTAASWSLTASRMRTRAKVYDLAIPLRPIPGELETRPERPIPLVVYYPVNRAILDIPQRIRKKHEFSQLAAYDGALLGGKREFRLFFEWFRLREDLENERRLEKSRYRDPQLEAVRDAIYAILPGFSNLRVRRKPLRMTIEKDGVELTINQLSDGEKCLLAMAGDLARRLAIANPGLKEPRQGCAVVLIDEVELHLHPGWQRDVIPRLRDAFPACQFVLVTHSPQVIGSVDHRSVRVLDDGQLFPDVAHTKGRDASSILEDVMGVPRHPQAVSEKLHRIAKLIDKERFDKARRELESLASELGDQDAEIVRMRAMVDFLDE